MDQKSSFKFPYFSSEILTSENVFIIDKFFEEEEENESRKNSDIQKEEIKIMNRGSSEIEININDDNNNENEIKEKSNNLKEKIEEKHINKDNNKLLNFLNSGDKEESIVTDIKTDLSSEISSKVIINIIPAINENLIVDNKETAYIEEKKINQSEENLDLNTSVEKIIKNVETKKTYSNLDYLFQFLSQ